MLESGGGLAPRSESVEELARALRESRLRFKALFDQAFGYRAILDRDGTVLEVNEGVLERTGMPREQVIGRPVWDTPWWSRLPEEQARLKDAVRRASAGEGVHDQPVYLVADGSERIGDRVFTPIKDEHDSVVCIGVEGHDITEQRLAGEALRRSELRFQAIFNQTFGAIGLLTPQGVVIDVNASALGGIEVDRATLIGLPFWRTAFWKGLPEEQQRVKTAIDEAAAGATVRSEFAYRDARGELRIVDLSLKPFRSDGGSVEFVIAEGRDVTLRKRADLALREREEQLRTLLDHAPEAIIVFDMDLGGFVDMNKNGRRMFGYSLEEMRNLTPGELSPPVQPNGRPSPEDAQRRLEQAIAGETPAFEWVHRRRDGTEFPSEVRLVRLPARGRRLIRGSITDISDRKRAEEERTRLEQQLRQSQKMETVGQLAGGIAHDFNNLLLAILGYSELAMEGMEESDPRLEHLHESQKAARRAAGLTRKMLAFSRRQVIQPEYLDLNRTIPDLKNMLRRLIPESIEISFLPGDNLRTVHADPGQFEHVIVNLCINARDAMPGGGRIEVETRNVELDADFCNIHPWAKPGEHVLIAVEDTGCGMPADVLEHIFEPFFTTKASGEGTGLGLAMVYGIVKQHDGAIHAFSEEGKGTSFRIFLPAVDHPAQPTVKKAPREIKGGTETLLVVEDEALVRDLAVRVLKRAGYEVLEARDGQEAIEVFGRHKPEISMVLLDVVMPRLGGREARDAIREISPGVRILFTSGYSTDGDIHSDYVLPRDLEILPKPYGPGRLLEAVRQTLDRGDA